MANLTTRVGTLTLKNPLIAAAAEHLIDEAGVRRAIAAGAGAVVVKSVNERDAAKDQLQRAEYAVLDAQWRPVAWDASAPMSATIACRSGLTPQSFDQWLEQTARLDREAAKADCYAVASLILSDLGEAVRMGKLVEQAGIRALEFNIGTPYASVTTQGNVTTEFDPARVGVMVAAMRQAIRLPLWIKLTGQSEQVVQPDAFLVFLAGRVQAGGRHSHLAEQFSATATVFIELKKGGKPLQRGADILNLFAFGFARLKRLQQVVERSQPVAAVREFAALFVVRANAVDHTRKGYLLLRAP